MASTEHKNRRRALALERLNIAVVRLASSKGIDAIEIPKKSKDKEMREIMVFERIASFLETLAGDDAPVLTDNPLVQKQANRAAPKTTRKTKQVIAPVSMEAK